MTAIVANSTLKSTRKVHPAEAILKRAAFQLDAARTPGTPAAGNTIQDLSANALRVQNGSIGNAKIIQDGRGGKALQLHGSGTARVTAPDSAAVSVTGDIDLRVQFGDAWTTGTSQVLISKEQTTATRSYRLSLLSDGRLYLVLSEDGSAARDAVSASSVTPSYGLWVRATWRASDQRVQFFTSTDNSSWTQVGADVSLSAAIASIHNNDSVLQIGGRTLSADPFAGKILRSQVYNGINGVLVADFDPSRDASFTNTTFTSSTTGETWTITGGGVDANDVLFLPAPSTYGVSRYVHVPDVATNGLTTGTSAAYNASGVSTIRVEADLVLDDWTAASGRGVTKIGGDVMLFSIASGSTGRLLIQYYDSTVTLFSATSTAAPPATDGGRYRIAAEVTSAGVVTFYSAPAGGAWVQLGSPVSVTGTPSGFRNIAAPSISAGTTDSARLNGSILSCRWLFDGVAVYDWDASRDPVNSTHTSFTASTGQTVTVARATSGRKTAVVEAPKWLLGTDDYIDVPDHPLLDFGVQDNSTVLVVFRNFETFTNGRCIIAKADSNASTVTAPRWFWRSTGSNALTTYIDDGTTVRSRSITLTMGAMNVASSILTASDLTAQLNTGTPSTVTRLTGSTVNASNMRIGGQSNTVSNNADFELYAVYIWREALTADELATINRYFNGNSEPDGEAPQTSVEDIYNRAVLAIDARRTPGRPGAGNTIQDLSRNALRTQNGATGNVKVVQDGRGGKALQCHNVNSAGAQSSVVPTYSTGAVRIEVGFRTSTLTGETDAIFGQATGTSNVSRMDLFINPSGGLQARIGTGSSDIEPTFNAFTWAADTEYFVACEWTPSTGDVRWFTSRDRGVSWVLVETDLAAVTPGATVQSGGNVVAGNRNTATAGTRGFLGQIYFGRMLFNGTLVADFDPTRDASSTSTSWTSSTTGETWTITGGGVEAADATYLPAPSTLGVTRYVHFPSGVANNRLTAGGLVNINTMTTTVRYTTRVRMQSWTSAGLSAFLGRGSTHSGIAITSSTGGRIIVRILRSSDVLPMGGEFAIPAGLVAGQWAWFDGQIDITTGLATLRWSNDQVTTPEAVTNWTTLTAATNYGRTGTPMSNTDVLIGNWTSGAGNADSIDVQYAREVVDGVTVLDWSSDRDAVNATHTSFTPLVGTPVTVSRATSGRKTAVVEAAKWLLGTDDYIEVADNALLDFGAADSFTALAVYRMFATPVGDNVDVVGKHAGFNAATNPGWGLGVRTAATPNAGIRIKDGAVGHVPNAVTYTPGAMLCLAGRVTASEVRSWLNGTLAAATTRTAGDLSNPDPLRIGRTSTVYADMELYAVYVWREALSEADLALINADWTVPIDDPRNDAKFALDATRTPGRTAAGNTVMDLSRTALRTASGATGNAKIVSDGRGGKALRTHGVAAANVGAVANQAPVYTTGNVRVEVKMRHPDASTGTSQSIFTLGTAAGANSQFRLQTDSTAALVRAIVGNGTTSAVPTCSAVPLTPGSGTWIVFALEWNPATGDFVWQTSGDDGQTWTTVETDAAVLVGPVQTPGIPHVGIRSASEPFNGLIGWARAYFNGVRVVDFDPSRDASFTTTSWTSATTGEVWTVTGGGVEAADVTYLPAPSTYGAGRYVWFPGAGANSLTLPNSVALWKPAGAGNLTMTALVMIPNFATGADQGVMGCGASSANGSNMPYMRITGLGELRCTWYDGALFHSLVGTGGGLVSRNGRLTWLRIRLTDTGSATSAALEWAEPTGSLTPPSTGWTSVGNPTGGPSIGAAVLGAQPTYPIGNSSIIATNQTVHGAILRVIQEVNGAVVLDWSAENPLTSNKSAFVASTGQVVAINRPASPAVQTTVVTEHNYGWLFGADDYIQLADSPIWDLGTTGTGTLLVVHEAQAAHGTGARLFQSADSGSLNGVILRYATTAGSNQIVGSVGDASGLLNSTATANIRTGAINATSFRVSSTQYYTRNNGVETQKFTRPAGAVDVAAGPRIGISQAGGNPFSGLIRAVYWWNRELSNDEIAYLESVYAEPAASSAEDLLREATVALDARKTNGGVQNWGTVPAVTATNPAAPNNVVYLPPPSAYDMRRYVYLPGATGNGLSALDSPSWTPTTSLDVRVWVSLDDWTPSAETALIGHYDTASNQRGWALSVWTTGTLFLRTCPDGISPVTAVSSVATGAADGSWLGVRAVWSAATPSVTFYTRTDSAIDSNTGWTTLGTVVTGATVAASIHNSTATLSIGPFAAAHNVIAGGSPSRHGRAVVVVDGTEVFDWSANDTLTSNKSVYVASTGQAVQINRSAAPSLQSTVVTERNYGWLLGDTDYVQLVDNATFDMGTTGTGTLLFVGEYQNGVFPANGYYLYDSSNTLAAPGNLLSAAVEVGTQSTIRWRFATRDAANVNSNNAVALLPNVPGRVVIHSGRVGASTLTSRANGVTTTTQPRTAGALDSAVNPRVGARSESTATNFSGLVRGFYWWPRALSDAEIAVLETEFADETVSSAEALYREATVALDARKTNGGVVNWGTIPAVTATNGSTAGVDANDTLFLPSPAVYGTTRYVYLPGVNGNCLTTPSSVGLDVAGDLDVIVDLALDDVTTTQQHFIVRDHQTGSLRIFYFTLTSGGFPQLVWWDSGGTTRAATCDVAPTLVNGRRFALRVTLDVDNGAGGHTVRFFTASTAAGPWTQVGTDRNAGAFTTSVRTGQVVNLGLGSANSTLLTATAAMRLYRAIVRNGIDGPAVFDWAATDTLAASKATFTASTGQTVTVNRSASPSAQTTVVTTTNYGWLFGQDDYIQLADNATWDLGTTGTGTLVIAAEYQAAVPAGGAYLFDSSGILLNSGYIATLTDTGAFTFRLRDVSGNAPAASALAGSSVGQLAVFTGRVSSTQFNRRVNGANGVAVTRPPGNVSAEFNPRVGTPANSTLAEFSGLIRAVYWWPRELSDAEIALIETDLTTS